MMCTSMISSLKIRWKLEVILHNMGNKWRMFHFFFSKKEKNRIWIDLSWIMEKIIGKVNKCNYWSLETTENFKKSQENVIKEANWVGMAILFLTPCGSKGCKVTSCKILRLKKIWRRAGVKPQACGPGFGRLDHT